MMNLNALKIDPEFQGKIPPLNFEEEQQLEQNILHEGRLLNPISSGMALFWTGIPATASCGSIRSLSTRYRRSNWPTATQLSHGSARTSLDAEISTRNGRSF